MQQREEGDEAACSGRADSFCVEFAFLSSGEVVKNGQIATQHTINSKLVAFAGNEPVHGRKEQIEVA